MLTLGSMLAGRYRAEALLGGGALGQVYRAWDEGTGGPVALRVLSADLLTDPYYVERLQRKAEALARLQHPVIARLQQIALDDGQPLLVMDYVEGSTLRQRLDAAAGPLPAGEILQVCEQICAALQYAHARGVLCGDLHPDNVLLANDGAVLLADYGLARTLADSALEPRSPDAPPPAYRSPEQCRGDAIDARADVYALGALLYEMSTGRPPFTGADLAIPGDSPAQRTCY